MTEYIEREAVKEAIGFVHLHFVACWENKSLLDVINEIPAADVAPVRHGRWIEKDKYAFGTFYDCSICGNRILDNGHSWNYCPNCGAKMEGGSD